jgi:hypothetical protein
MGMLLFVPDCEHRALVMIVDFHPLGQTGPFMNMKRQRTLSAAFKDFLGITRACG